MRPTFLSWKNNYIWEKSSPLLNDRYLYYYYRKSLVIICTKKKTNYVLIPFMHTTQIRGRGHCPPPPSHGPELIRGSIPPPGIRGSISPPDSNQREGPHHWPPKPPSLGPAIARGPDENQREGRGHATGPPLCPEPSQKRPVLGHHPPKGLKERRIIMWPSSQLCSDSLLHYSCTLQFSDKAQAHLPTPGVAHTLVCPPPARGGIIDPWTFSPQCRIRRPGPLRALKRWSEIGGVK